MNHEGKNAGIDEKLWRVWEERGKRANKQHDRMMRGLMIPVGIALIALLFYWK
jgi:hypothetical protein